MKHKLNENICIFEGDNKLLFKTERRRKIKPFPFFSVYEKKTSNNSNNKYYVYKLRFS